MSSLPLSDHPSDHRSSTDPEKDFGEDGGDDGGDDDDDGEGGGGIGGDFGGLGGGGGGGAGGDDNEEGSIQLLPDTDEEDEEESSSSDDDNTDNNNSDNLTDKQRREKSRQYRAKKRSKAENRAKRDEKRFLFYLNQLENKRKIKQFFFPLSDKQNNEPAEVLVLNEYNNNNNNNEDNNNNKGGFRPLFICLPSPKSRLSSVLSSYLIHHYSLPLIADISSPLFPELSHINRALPSAPLRFYGRSQQEIIELKTNNNNNNNNKKKSNNNHNDKKKKKHNNNNSGSTKEEEKKQGEGKESTGVSQEETIEKINAPPFFLLTSDLLLSTVQCSSLSLLYSSLLQLILSFSCHYSISHIFFFSSLPISISLNLKGGIAEDMTKKQLERFIKRAAKIGDYQEKNNQENDGEGAAGGDGGDNNNNNTDTIGGTHSVPLSSSSSSIKSHQQPSSTPGTTTTTAPRSPRSKGGVSPKFKPRSTFLQSSSSNKLSKKNKNNDEEEEEEDDNDDLIDPEDKKDEEEEKKYLLKQLETFLYYGSNSNDIKLLSSLGGRLISNALLSGLIAAFFNYAIRPSINNNNNNINTPSIILLTAYYNPLLSDLFAAIKIASTLNKFINSLPLSSPPSSSSLSSFFDLIQLENKAKKLSKKIKKALLHSIAEQSDTTKQASMYM